MSHIIESSNLKALLRARILQLAQEQDAAKAQCVRHFGGFKGEVLVPNNLSLTSDERLIEILEALTTAKAVRGLHS